MMIVHFNCKSFIQSWRLCVHSWISLICKILVLPVSFYSQNLQNNKQPLSLLFFHRLWHRIWDQHSRVGDVLVLSLGHFLHNGFLKPSCSAEQQTVVYLFSPVKQSVDTNSPSHSHAPRRHEIPQLLRWNSSLPGTNSHSTALFWVHVCATTMFCALLPHIDIVVITTSVESKHKKTVQCPAQFTFYCLALAANLADKFEIDLTAAGSDITG